MKYPAILAAVLLFSNIAMASDRPAVPSRYWTTENAGLVTLDAIAKSADMFFTMRNAARAKFQEHDPLARPFVTHGPACAGALQGLLFAAEVFTSYKLTRHGHPKVGKALLIVGIGGNSAGIVSSTRP